MPTNVTGEIKVQPCIDVFHSFAPLPEADLPTVYCTKCGTPITYKIEGTK